MIIYAIFILSFLLDGLLSIYSEFDWPFITFFSVIALVLVYPYFLHHDKNYFKACLILGIAYDLIYTNTIFFNMLLFLLLGVIIKKMYDYFTNNILNSILINLIVILFYLLCSYFILILIGYLPLDISLIIDNLLSIIIINNIYFILIYLVVRLIAKKRKIDFVT